MNDLYELNQLLTGDFDLAPQHVVRIDRAVLALAGGPKDAGKREIINSRTGQKETVLLDEDASSPCGSFEAALEAISPLAVRLKFLNLTAVGGRFIATLDRRTGLVEGPVCNSPARAVLAAVFAAENKDQADG